MRPGNRGNEGGSDLPMCVPPALCRVGAGIGPRTWHACGGRRRRLRWCSCREHSCGKGADGVRMVCGKGAFCFSAASIEKDQKFETDERHQDLIKLHGESQIQAVREKNERVGRDFHHVEQSTQQVCTERHDRDMPVTGHYCLDIINSANHLLR